MNSISANSPIWRYIFNIANWNLIIILIFSSSILGFTIFIERWRFLKRSEGDTNKILLNIRKNIQEGNYIEAISYCKKESGSVAAVLKAGIMRHNSNKVEIEDAMEIEGILEISKLEKNVKILSIIAHITPLIGLLGTVLGFIHAFSEMRLSGLIDISTSNIGAAMEYALMTTAAGLTVAIPSFIAYSYLSSRIEGIVLEMQMASAKVCDLLINRQDDYDF